MAKLLLFWRFSLCIGPVSGVAGGHHELAPLTLLLLLSLLFHLSCALVQSLLRVLSEVGQRHSVSISDVACRWVLDKPQVRNAHVLVLAGRPRVMAALA